MQTGQCHCGNIQLSVEQLPTSLTSCNCSICRRYASLWGYYKPTQVVIVQGQHGLSSYAWGDEYLEFHHCEKCKCITHYTSTSASPVERVGINFRMFEPHLVDPIQIRHFDGADSWEFLDGK